jgi:hypothetical protein
MPGTGPGSDRYPPAPKLRARANVLGAEVQQLGHPNDGISDLGKEAVYDSGLGMIYASLRKLHILHLKQQEQPSVAGISVVVKLRTDLEALVDVHVVMRRNFPAGTQEEDAFQALVDLRKIRGTENVAIHVGIQTFLEPERSSCRIRGNLAHEGTEDGMWDVFSNHMLRERT